MLLQELAWTHFLLLLDALTSGKKEWNFCKKIESLFQTNKKKKRKSASKSTKIWQTSPVWGPRLHLNWRGDRRDGKHWHLTWNIFGWLAQLETVTLLTHIIQMALIHISLLSFWGFTLRSLRFCLRSTEAEPRQDLGRVENLACVSKAWRNDWKWLRISCEVTLTCRPQPTSLQAQHRSTALCHSRSSPFLFFFPAEAVYASAGGGSSGDLDGSYFLKNK